MRIITAVLFSSIVLMLSGCGGGGGGGGGNTGGTGVTGFWTGSGAYQRESGGTMAFTMNLNLTQSGTVVTGTYHIERPNRTMDGSISGTISGGSIQMAFNPHGSANGTVSGGTMSLSFFEDWGGGKGLNGTITLGRP